MATSRRFAHLYRSRSVSLALTPETLCLILVLETCAISVEVAGPSTPQTLPIVPNILRQMASWVIRRCVQIEGGNGGFVTAGLGNMVDYVVTHGIPPELLETQLRTMTSFPFTRRP